MAQHFSVLALGVWLAVACGTATVLAGCTTDLDCSLNGVCQSSGVCTCDPEWIGPSCSSLNLGRPTTVDPAYPPPEVRNTTTSWGGSVVRDPSDGLYHMFVAEMANGCGMTTWSTNSIIRHAVASTPTGPFKKMEIVMPPFAHNPTAIRAPDGTYLIYHIGCGDGRPGYPPCTDCSGGKSGSSCHGPAEQNGCTATTTNILYSSSLNGPWKQLNATFINSPTMKWPGFDNPTVLFFPNGSLIGLSRGGNPAAEAESDGVVTAPSWKGPYTFHDMVGTPSSPQVEDPFIYMDHRGNFHALFHKFTDEHPYCGGHAFSKNGFDWTLTNEPAYNTSITTSDGVVHSFTRRERPHLLFDSTGRPSVLYTTLTNWGGGDDSAYTFGHPIRTAML